MQVHTDFFCQGAEVYSSSCFPKEVLLLTGEVCAVVLTYLLKDVDVQNKSEVRVCSHISVKEKKCSPVCFTIWKIPPPLSTAKADV